MSGINKYIYIITICIILAVSKAYAEEINFNSTINQAIDNSYDLKISEFDIKISHTDIKNTKSELYPTLNSQLNTEYSQDLDNNSSVDSVGSTVLSTNTKFQNLVSFNLSYNLFDFGAAGKKVYIAKKNLEQKELSYNIQLKDLKLKILDLYTKSLIYNNEIILRKELANIYQELFLSREKLFEAGTINKIAVMDEAVKIARNADSIESLKTNLNLSLKDLSQYTKQDYNIDNLVISPIEDNKIVPVSDIKGTVQEEICLIPSFKPEFTPESKYYDAEIEKKKAELEIYKKERFPALKFYSNYSFYGQKKDNPLTSIKDVDSRSLSVGISSVLPVFDGFKNKSNREKAILEIKKLKIEKEKKLSELKNDYEKSYTSYLLYKSEFSVKQQLLNKINDKLNAVERLILNGLTAKPELFEQKAQLLSQQIELEKSLINISSKIKETQIIAGEDK